MFCLFIPVFQTVHIYVVHFFLSDEDMQSLASLMSVKPTDIGNLDDFNESDEEEDKKSVTATGRKTYTQHCFFSLILTVNYFHSDISLPSFSSVIPVNSSSLLFFLLWLLQ